MPAENDKDKGEDRSIERLVRELGQLIEKAEPEKREEIRQMAASLMDEEMRRAGITQQERAQTPRRPLNPIALSGFVLILGIGLSFALPPVGLILIGAGIMGLILGGISSLIQK